MRHKYSAVDANFFDRLRHTVSYSSSSNTKRYNLQVIPVRSTLINERGLLRNEKRIKKSERTIGICRFPF